jgi:uncharacterized membrane protein
MFSTGFFNLDIVFILPGAFLVVFLIVLVVLLAVFLVERRAAVSLRFIPWPPLPSKIVLICSGNHFRKRNKANKTAIIKN